MSGRRKLKKNRTVKVNKPRRRQVFRNNTVGRPRLLNNKTFDKAEKKLRQTDLDFTKILGNKTYHTLTYVEDDVLTNSSVDFALDTYRISDIFDPNPAFLTGGTTGYQELIGIFFKWIVLCFYLDISIVNQEPAKPITVGILFNPDNLSSTILSRTNAINALERPGTMVKSQMIAPLSGQNRMMNLHFQVKPSTVYGNTSLYFGSVNFSGSAAAGPPNELFLHIIYIGPASLSLSVGTLTSVKLSFDVKFFSVTPALLSDKQEELRFLFSQHKLQLKLLGGSVKNKKVLQCRLDFLETITPYFSCIRDFFVEKQRAIDKINNMMKAIIEPDAVIQTSPYGGMLFGLKQ